ncbi:MAG: transglutaminase-like domain-containing protein [Candidatus Micrarchaeota archaeon]|nr:transglutaminase-like domain-containing protein [Candidatus Micrarchaeota archaeon]
MQERRSHPAYSLLCLSLSLLVIFSLSGCCGYTEAAKGKTNQTVTPSGNHPPVVDLSLEKYSGPVPFYPRFTYEYSDPDGNLVALEMKIDGKVFARGHDADSFFPKNYTYPDFYREAENTMGNHTLEIIATDSNGSTASKTVTFTVLTGLPISKPGWYTCNSRPNNPPCDTMLEGYCDKFDERDLAVRQAAAAAISKHPGTFSINQLLDIYDYVHSNVFYQNVPLDMWPPYYPNQTLATKSGDCKNQAVLIASMVEAIGGSARVLLVPDCEHAFAEVYLGTDIDTSIISGAIGSHYNTNGKGVNYHTNRNADNKTDYWFIFDTAGGSFPGQTIPECLKANYTFEVRDCNRPLDALQAPESQGTEYGPFRQIDETKVIYPDWGWNYWQDMDNIGRSGIKWCHLNLTVKSLSPTPLDWHITDEEGYQNSQAHRSYSYYYGEEQVMQGSKGFDWSKPERFYIILNNRNQQSSITVKTELVETCYKS